VVSPEVLIPDPPVPVPVTCSSGGQITSDEPGEPIWLRLHASGFTPEPPTPGCEGSVVLLLVSIELLVSSGLVGTVVLVSMLLGVVVVGVEPGSPPVSWPAPPTPISAPREPGGGAFGVVGRVVVGCVCVVAGSGVLSRAER